MFLQFNVVAKLTDMRKADFVHFPKGLAHDSVMLIKVLTAVDIPALQEGLLIADLQGNAQLLNMTEILQMTDEERRNESGELQDIRSLLTDSNRLKIVENVADLVRFGERIFMKLDAGQFTSLQAWHPQMGCDFMGSIRYEFPEQQEPLMQVFQGTSHFGWRWDLQLDTIKEKIHEVHGPGIPEGGVQGGLAPPDQVNIHPGEVTL